MRITLLSLFLLLPIMVFGQDNSCEDITTKLQAVEKKFSRQDLELSRSLADSIYGLLNEDCQKASMFYEIIQGRYSVKKGQLDQGSERFKKAYSFASDLNLYVFQKHIRSHQAQVKYNSEEYESALELCKKAIEIPCEKGDVSCLKANIRIKINSTLYLKQLNKFEDAIKVYLEAEQLLNEYNFNDSIYRVSIHNGIGNIYDSELGNKRASLLSYQKALVFCPHKHNSRFLLYNNIGNRFKDLSEIDSARYYYNKTINNANISSYLVVPYQGLGDINLDLLEYQKGIENYSEALTKALDSGVKSKVFGTKVLLGKAYFLNSEFLQAKPIFDEVRGYYEKNETIDSYRTQVEKYCLLNDVALQNPNTAKQMYAVFENLDSLQSIERVSALDNSISKYEKLLLRDSLQKVELINVSQNLKIKNQNLSTILLSLLAILGLMGAYYFRRSLKSQETKNTELIFENDELTSMNSNLEARLNLVLDDLKKTEDTNLLIPVARKKVKLEFEEIKYLSAESNGTRVYATNKSLWTDIALKDILKELPSKQFLQIFRGTIININNVKEIDKSNVILKDGTNLKIGRSYKKSIQQTFED